METNEEKVKILTKITITGIILGIGIYLFIVLMGLTFKHDSVIAFFGGIMEICAIMVFAAFIWEVIDDQTEETSFWLFRKKEIRIIEKGNAEWYAWYIGRNNELSHKGQIKLVKLAGIAIEKADKTHWNMLREYKFELCYNAALLFVETLLDHLEEYLATNMIEDDNNHILEVNYQKNILSILVNGTKDNPKYREAILNLIINDEYGYTYLKNFISTLIENGETEILTEYLKRQKYLEPRDEVKLVQKADKDPDFKKVLSVYLDAIESNNERCCGTKDSMPVYEAKDATYGNNLSKEAENEVVDGSLSIIKLYLRYVKTLRDKAQIRLAERYEEEQDEDFKKILLQQNQLHEEAQDIISKNTVQ